MEKLLLDEEARLVLKRILSLYPGAKGELHWDTKFHLLCAVLMSAQTIDKMVSKTTPKFFSDYPDSASLAQASIKNIEAHIHTIGLYRIKVEHLRGTAQITTDKPSGEVPKDKKTLMTLPGIGEKMANVVLAEDPEIPAIAVDTHVFRISERFKIVGEKATPHRVEQRLEELLPKEEWIHTRHAMILFGRYTAPAGTKDRDPYSFLPPLKWFLD